MNSVTEEFPGIDAQALFAGQLFESSRSIVKVDIRQAVGDFLQFVAEQLSKSSYRSLHEPGKRRKLANGRQPYEEHRDGAAPVSNGTHELHDFCSKPARRTETKCVVASCANNHQIGLRVNSRN